MINQKQKYFTILKVAITITSFQNLDFPSNANLTKTVKNLDFAVRLGYQVNSSKIYLTIIIYEVLYNTHPWPSPPLTFFIKVAVVVSKYQSILAIHILPVSLQMISVY